MNHSLLSAIAACMFLAAAPSTASADPAKAKEIANRNACLGCHAVNSRILGPSYTEVAARYKGQDAISLAASIRSGGKGKWGAMAMPAQASLSEGDALLLAQWILAGSPAN